MPTPPLVIPSDLTGFPGAPFDETLVNAAAESVRSEAGWHIAPVVTETLRVKSWGGTDLVIPSLRILSVTAVRYGLVTYVGDWTLLPDGLYRRSGWPVGVIEVDLIHGYDATPAELLPVIVQRVKSSTIATNVSQRSTTRGPFSESETYREQAASAATDPTVARYSVRLGIA